MIRPIQARTDPSITAKSTRPALSLSGGFFILETLYCAMPTAPDHRLTLRFKPDEYAVLRAKAGNRPLSTYVRETVLEKAANKRKQRNTVPVKDHEALGRVLALLGQHRLVADFKAVARLADREEFFTEVDPRAKIDEGHAFLEEIRSLIMRALGVAER